MKPERIQEPWTVDLPGWQLQQKDTLCRSFVFEDAFLAHDFVIGLCRVAKQRQQKPCFRVRDGHVFVQCAIPVDGASEDMRLLARDLNDLRSSLP